MYSDYDFSIFKCGCVCCERSDVKLSKEHVMAQWLLKRTKTLDKMLPWVNGKRIPGKACTLPLCSDCNRRLGKEIEQPVSVIFDNLETKGVINDQEVELLCRWMWKISGIFWWATHPDGMWGPGRTMKDQVLMPIRPPRDRIAVALAHIDHIDSDHGDLPLGIDVMTHFSAVLSAGVFSQTAIIVHLAEFSDCINKHYTIHRLLSKPSRLVLIHPKTGFKDDNEAVFMTILVAKGCLKKHEMKAARRLLRLLKDRQTK